MKRFCVYFLQVTFLIVGFAEITLAQTADEVVSKHLAALGGREALGKLKSRKTAGTITLSTQAGDLSGSMETYAKAPNKSRSYMKIDLSAFGQGELVVDQRFDGNAGYSINSMQGNEEITGNRLDNLRNNVFPSNLLNYKEAGIKIEVLPKEKVGERDAIVLMVTPKAGSAIKEYLDAESYLRIKTIVKVNVPQMGGDIEQTNEFSDYREVDGVKIPFQVSVTNPAQSFTIKVNKVEHNITIEDSLFVKPAADKQD